MKPRNKVNKAGYSQVMTDVRITTGVSSTKFLTELEKMCPKGMLCD
jgi:hypothetical protein